MKANRQQTSSIQNPRLECARHTSTIGLNSAIIFELLFNQITWTHYSVVQFFTHTWIMFDEEFWLHLLCNSSHVWDQLAITKFEIGKKPNRVSSKCIDKFSSIANGQKERDNCWLARMTWDLLTLCLEKKKKWTVMVLKCWHSNSKYTHVEQIYSLYRIQWEKKNESLICLTVFKWKYVLWIKVVTFFHNKDFEWG